MPTCINASSAQFAEINALLSERVFSKSLKQSVALALLYTAFRQEPMLFGMDNVQNAEDFIRRENWKGVNTFADSKISPTSSSYDNVNTSMMPFYYIDSSCSGSANNDGASSAHDGASSANDGGSSSPGCSSGSSSSSCSSSSSSSCGGGCGGGGGGCGGGG